MDTTSLAEDDRIDLLQELDEIQVISKTGGYRIDFINNKFFGSSGYLAIHEIDKPFSSQADFISVVNPEDQEIIRSIMMNEVQQSLMYNTGFAPIDITYRITSPKSKQVKSIRDKVKPLFVDDRFVGIRGVIQDITSEINQREELVRLNDYFKESQELAGIGIWNLEFSTNKITWSQGQRAIYELDDNEESPDLEEYLKLYVMPDDHHKLFQTRDQILQSKSGKVQRTLTVRTKKGSIKQVLTIAKIKRNINQDEIGISGITLDITQIKEKELLIEQYRDQLLQIQQMSGAGSWFLDVLKNSLQVTEGYCKVFGLRLEDAPKTLDEAMSFVHPDDIELARTEYASLVLSPYKPREIVLRIRTGTGQTKYVKAVTSSNIKEDKVVSIFGSVIDVTRFKEYESKITESQERFLNVFKYSGLGIAILSKEGKFIEINETLLNITGYKIEELRRLTIEQIIPASSKGKFLELLDLSIHGNKDHFEIEMQLLGKVQSLIWVSTTLSVIREEGGSCKYLIALFKDDTEKVHSRNKSIEYQRLFISAFHGSSVGLAISTLDGKIVDLNKSLCKIFGYSKDEILKLTIAKLTHPDDVRLDVYQRNLLIEEKIEGYTIEKRFIHKSGVIVYCEVTTNLIKDASGKAQYLTNQLIDVTNRIQNEKIIVEERRKFETIFKYSGIGMTLASTESIILNVNSALCELLEYSREEMIGRSFYDITHPDDISNNQELHTTLITQAVKRYAYKKRYKKKNGGIAYCQVTAVLYQNKDSDEKYLIAQIQDLTELKQEQTSRIESEERYRYIVENAHVGIGFSKDSEIIYANPALLRILEYPNFAEYATCPLEELALPETVALIRNRWAQAKKGKTLPPVYIGRFYSKNKNIKTLEVQVRYINMETEQYSMAIVTDLSDKLQLEQQLRDTQMIFNQAERFAKIGTWRWKMDSNKVYWSESIYSLFGMKKNGIEITFEMFMQFVHPDDRNRISRALKNSIEGNTSYQVEHRIVLNNGKIKWLSEKGNVLRDSTGQVVEMFGVSREITKEKIIAEELYRSKEQYKLLAESGQELICLHSLDGHFLYASPSLRNLLGYNPNKLPATVKSIDLVHPDDKENFHAFIQNAIENPTESFTGRFRFLHKKGNYLWCEKNVKAVKNDLGNISSIRSLTRNIENQIAFENRIQLANTQLEKALIDLKEASEAKENFLSIMSHEIRTPLNAVIGLSNLLLKRNPREDQQEVVNVLKNSADNLLHLVNDILDFNKIQSGNLKLEIIPFRLSELMQQQYAAFQVLAQEKCINFDLTLDPEIPDDLEGDVTRLNQIFTNLLTNAIKFTLEGYVRLGVALVERNQKECILKFTVEDSGIGIQLKDQQSIFKPFQQSNLNISRKFGGTGLGLSIVNSLLVLMGGTIDVQSEPEKGSCFVITLKFGIRSKSIVHNKFLNQSHKMAVTQPLQVLYVEDVESNRFLISNLLTDHNCNCLTVSSGKAALRVTKSKKFDVILMDIQMPVYDGYETTRLIRTQEEGLNRQTPVIAFTAEPYSPSLKDRVLLNQIQYVITKPFNAEFLLEKIHLFAQQGIKKSAFFSFTFYEEIFHDDVVKLNQIKTAIVSDLTSLGNDIQRCAAKKDIMGLRTAIHKLNPIIKNLACHELVNVFKELQLHDVYLKDTAKAVKKTDRLITRLIAKVGKLKFDK